MDEIALVKKQVIEAEWADKIRQCRESGLTVSEWCKENDINYKTYYYHLRKVRKKICEQIPVPVMTVPEERTGVKIRIGDMIVYAAASAHTARTNCPPSPLTAHGRCPENCVLAA